MSHLSKCQLSPHSAVFSTTYSHPAVPGVPDALAQHLESKSLVSTRCQLGAGSHSAAGSREGLFHLQTFYGLHLSPPSPRRKASLVAQTVKNPPAM